MKSNRSREMLRIAAAIVLNGAYALVVVSAYMAALAVSGEFVETVMVAGFAFTPMVSLAAILWPPAATAHGS